MSGYDLIEFESDNALWQVSHCKELICNWPVPGVQSLNRGTIVPAERRSLYEFFPHFISRRSAGITPLFNI